MLVNVFDESRAVDSGGAPLEFEGSEKIKEDRKRDKQSITTSTPRFEKLSMALMSEHSISESFWVGVPGVPWHPQILADQFMPTK